MTGAAWASPRLYPLRMDGEWVNLLELGEEDYRAASFLDERLLSDRGPGVWRPWEQARAAAAHLAGESDYIFHTGHVGSTLLSRLLGRSRSIFSLREPALLRPLASAASVGAAERARLGELMRLYARTWRPAQRSLIKTTSFVSELAGVMLALAPTSRAILLFTAPQIFIAGILAGEATRAELDRVTPARLARLARRTGVQAAEPASAGERAGAGWTAEICALAEAAAAFPQRTLWVDFDQLLAEPRLGLRRMLTFLGRGEEADIARMIAAGDLERYAKDPAHRFDTAARRDILGRALADHRGEIERGLAWINRAGSASAQIAEATRAAAAGRAAERV